MKSDWSAMLAAWVVLAVIIASIIGAMAYGIATQPLVLPIA